MIPLGQFTIQLDYAQVAQLMAHALKSEVFQGYGTQLTVNAVEQSKDGESFQIQVTTKKEDKA